MLATDSGLNYGVGSGTRGVNPWPHPAQAQQEELQAEANGETDAQGDGPGHELHDPT